MSRRKCFFCFSITLLMFLAFNTFAQVTSGNLQGVVKDPNGAVLAGATVKVINTENGNSREVQTNSEGFYRVTNLLPGSRYKIEVTASGFAPFLLENVSILLGTENSADIQMKIQGASGVVDVSTGSGELLQTTQNQLSTDFSTKQVTQLPLNGGGIDNLALLVPGVAQTGDTTFANGTGITANGNRGRSNNFQIDGQDNNDNSVTGPSLYLTNTDAVGGYQVITNNFSAEFGRNSGAQINTITKAGTNNFHGTTFIYHNNSALDSLTNFQKQNANNFKFLATNGFNDFAGLANRKGKDPFRTNTFGGSIGGPIKADKAFFFATYQGTYNRGEGIGQSNIATGAITFDRASAALARQLFSNPATAQLVSTAVGGGPAFVQGVGTLLIAPQTVDLNGDGIIDTVVYGPGNPFGAAVTPNRLTPSLYVCAVNPGAGNPCPTASLRTLYTGEPVRILPTNSSADEFITREDFNLTDKDVISARYIYNSSRFPLATGRAAAGALFDVPSKNHNLGGTYTRILSSNWTNEARFNFSYLGVRFGDPDNLPGPGIAFSGQRDLEGNFASLPYGTPSTLPQSRDVVVYQEQDTLIATLSNHALKFGFDFRQQRTKNFFLPNFLGTYTFRGGSAAGTVPAGAFYYSNGLDRSTPLDCDGDPTTPNTPCPTLAFENLLLNRPRDIAFAVGNPRFNINQDDYFFFVQDDWRARSNLTFNLGLRYELSSQPFNQLINNSNSREANSATAIFGSSFPLETRTLKTLPLDTNNIAPRVGFAWSPNFDFLGQRFTNGRTVLRGGIGVSYDPSFFNIVLNTITAAPFVGAGFIRQNDPGVSGAVGVPFLPTTPAQLSQTPGTNGGDPRLFNQTRISDDFHNPYTVSYNFGIQQELWRNTVLEVRYVGSLIRDQFQTVNGNPDLKGLAAAGQFLFGDPKRFTNGNAVTAYTGASGVVNVPGNTLASFNTRGLDATGVRINGSGRLDPNYGAVRLRTNGAHGHYNGLQTEFRTRFSNLSVNAAYTFSKTIDNSSEIFTSGGGGQTVAVSQNPFDTDKGERGLSAFHQKHNFTANFVYDLPFFRDQRGFTGKLLGGFQMNGIIRIGSGQPYTPVVFFGSVDTAFEALGTGGFGVLRPFVGNPNAPKGTIAFGNSAAEDIFGDGQASPGQFVIYNTLQPGSTGKVVSAQEAMQQAQLIYNDFGLFTNAQSRSLSQLEAFNLFKTPYGNLGRNTFIGDSFSRVNISIIKQTRISEGKSIEFRSEITNLFNHRNFGVPDPVTEDAVNSISGRVATFLNPGYSFGGNRSIRMGLKFIF